MRRATILLLPASLILAPPAPLDAGPSRGFAFVARTAHASYYAPARSSVDVERSEAFLSRLFALFGPPPPDWHLEYYLHSTAGSLRADSGARAIGFFDVGRNRIDSTRPYHPHELVHAVAGRLGRAPVFFEEGLAVALTSGGRWGERSVDDIAREALAGTQTLDPYLTAFGAQDPAISYPVAGSFVAFLLERHGVLPFVDFLRRCDSPATGCEGAFRRAYGRSLARARIEWRALLARGNVGSWAWADPESWPQTLQSGTVARAAVAPLAPPPPTGELLLSRDEPAGEGLASD